VVFGVIAGLELIKKPKGCFGTRKDKTNFEGKMRRALFQRETGTVMIRLV